jgi:Putative prokaryotic signal transducing protein
MQQIQIASFDNYLLANMTMGLLQQNGIECNIKDQNTILTDPLLSNAIGGIKLVVAQADEQSALALIKEAENIYLKEIPCKICNTNNLQIHEYKNEPSTFWHKLKNNILYGQTNLYTKQYKCSKCNSLYDTLFERVK